MHSENNNINNDSVIEKKKLNIYHFNVKIINGSLKV